MEDAIIFPYREGRLEQVLDIMTRIAENMNSVQRAVQYSRRRFLDAILYSKSIPELQNCLMRDGWRKFFIFKNTYLIIIKICFSN